jgi:hypothetical protein
METNEDARISATSQGDVTTSPRTERPGTEELLLLSDILQSFLQTLSEGVEQDGEQTYASHDACFAS